MFEIIFLGTSASAPSAKRNLPALVVKHDEYRFLVDCGEGTQRQILQSGIGFKRLNDILITHGHLDHILGLAGLLSTFMRWETIDELRIHGGRSALDRISDLLNAAGECVLLVTNLASAQLMRMAELLDVPAICLVNEQTPDDNMLRTAQEHATAILVSPAGLFETCGRLHRCLTEEEQGP